MGIQTKEVSVGGRAFKLTQLPAKRGTRLFHKLCRIAMPAAAKVFSKSKGISLKALLSADLGGISDGVEMLFAKLDEDEQERVLLELFEGARIRLDGGKWADLAEVYDDVFAGRINEVYALAVEALRLNFSSFLPALNAAFSAAKSEQAASESQSTEMQ